MAFALALMVPAASSWAQSHESRGSISAVGGLAKTFDDESSLGRGLLIGGAADRVLFGKTRLELSAEMLRHDRSEGYFLSEGRTLIGAVSVMQRFGSGSMQPYVFGGLTAGHHSGTNTFAGERRSVLSTDAGYRLGVGSAFRAGQRYEIGPELRWNGFFTDNDASPWAILSFGIRVGWRL